MDICKGIVTCLESLGIMIEPDMDSGENLFEFGLDSLGFITLICDIEQRFNIEVPDECLSELSTITVNKLHEVVLSCLQ